MPENNRKPSEAVATNDADFEAMAIFANGNDRGQSACDEIAVLDRLVRRFETCFTFSANGSSFGSSKARSFDDIAARSWFFCLTVEHGARSMALSLSRWGRARPEIKRVRIH